MCGSEPASMQLLNPASASAAEVNATVQERAEAAFFYQALRIARRLEPWIVLGIGLAILILSVIGWAIIALGARLPTWPGVRPSRSNRCAPSERTGDVARCTAGP